MIEFHVPGEPVAFARSGGNGTQRFTPKKQRDFMALVKLAGSKAMEGRELLSGPLHASIVARYSIPASWPIKRRAEALWKESRPDIDNLAKLTADALNDIVYQDDAQICSLHVEKIYGNPTGFSIRIEAAPAMRSAA